MEQAQPLTPDLFAVLAQAPGHIRATGVVIDGQPFIVIHERRHAA
jgi:hypothetical protein